MRSRRAEKSLFPKKYEILLGVCAMIGLCMLIGVFFFAASSVFLCVLFVIQFLSEGKFKFFGRQNGELLWDKDRTPLV